MGSAVKELTYGTHGGLRLRGLLTRRAHPVCYLTTRYLNDLIVCATNSTVLLYNYETVCFSLNSVRPQSAKLFCIAD